MTEFSQEFVVFDINGKEIEWIDPVVSHEVTEDGTHLVGNSYSVYEVQIPDGGAWTIRKRKGWSWLT